MYNYITGRIKQLKYTKSHTSNVDTCTSRKVNHEDIFTDHAESTIVLPTKIKSQ